MKYCDMTQKQLINGKNKNPHFIKFKNKEGCGTYAHTHTRKRDIEREIYEVLLLRTC